MSKSTPFNVKRSRPGTSLSSQRTELNPTIHFVQKVISDIIRSRQTDNSTTMNTAPQFRQARKLLCNFWLPSLLDGSQYSIDSRHFPVETRLEDMLECWGDMRRRLLEQDEVDKDKMKKLTSSRVSYQHKSLLDLWNQPPNYQEASVLG